MFSLPSMPESITSLFKHRAEPGIRLDTVETHDVDANQGPSGKAIKHLLKLNHATYSLLYHDMGYHNHMAHVRKHRLQHAAGMAYLGVRSLGQPIYFRQTSTTSRGSTTVSLRNWKNGSIRPAKYQKMTGEITLGTVGE